MNNREEDARNALLAHYSAKSTAQTAVLVGLAVVFFASVQAYDVLRKLKLSFGLDWAFWVFSIISIIFFGVRAIGRLVYFGELATAILSVEMLSPQEIREGLENGSQRPRRDLRLFYPEIQRLGAAAQKRAIARMKMRASLPLRILFITDKKWFTYVYEIALIGLVLLVFHLWLLS
jgi:hypothetical protein